MFSLYPGRIVDIIRSLVLPTQSSGRRQACSAGVEDLTAILMKTFDLWDVVTCRFEGYLVTAS